MKMKISTKDALYLNAPHKDSRKLSLSSNFRRFLRLGAAMEELGRANSIPEGDWAGLQDQRDALAKTIVANPARALSEVFEKLFIWRMECLEPSDGGFVYFDDLFPLSAYFDLRRMVFGEEEATPRDAELLSHLRNWREPD